MSDALIPLMVQRPKLMGGGEVLALRDLAQRFQMNQMELGQARRDEQDQIKLRELFSGQGSFDPQGNPTQQTISQAMGISPKAGMALSGQAQANAMRLSQIDANMAQVDVRNLEVNKRKSEILNSIKEKAVAAYDLALKGGSEESAKKAYEDTFRMSVQELDEAGSLSFVSDEEKQKMLTSVLPIEYARASTTKLSDLTKQTEHREDITTRLRETEQARADRKENARLAREQQAQQHRERMEDKKEAREAKPMPASAAGKLLENKQNLSMAERALAEVNKYSDATGWKGFAGDTILQRTDPEGVNARAALANIGSLVIHDRSGAAVTAAEFPRLRPFIPNVTDDHATVVKKLKQFISVYQDVVDDTENHYRESGYKVPESKREEPKKPSGSKLAPWPKDLGELKEGTVYETPSGPGKYLGKGENGKLRFAKPGAEPVKVETDADVDALPAGAEFIGPDGNKYRKR